MTTAASPGEDRTAYSSRKKSVISDSGGRGEGHRIGKRKVGEKGL